jgi:hypothetical protein
MKNKRPKLPIALPLLEGKVASARPFILTTLIGLATVSALASAVPQAAARDRSTNNIVRTSEDIRVLQQRLTDAGCYKGPVDGQTKSALATAQKYCPDQDPILRIETGMHVAPINQIGVDAQCRIAATASDDKTVRLWSMPEGRLIRTARLPIGEGNKGKLYSLAISPDGQLVAAGGWDAWPVEGQHGVYLIATATGTSLRRIGNFGDVIDYLAFSSDASKLAVALGAGQGIRVLDVSSGREIMADKDFAGDSYGIAFGPDGALYATSYDGFIRRYGPDLKRTAKVAAPSDSKQLYRIAVDPSGRKLAVGYSDIASVDLLDARDLHRLGAADTENIESGDLATIAWTKDGTRLVAGGGADHQIGGKSRYFLRSFSPDGRMARPDAAEAADTIESLAACRDAMAFAAKDPSFGLLPANGSAVTLQKGRTFDARGKLGAAFTISGDATKLRFGLGYGNDQPVVFDLDAGTLRDAPAPIAGLHEATVKGLAVTDWEDAEKPLFKGRPIAIDQNETARALAVRADRSGFALGAEWSLRGFDASGTQRWQMTVPGTAWGTNFSADGRLLVGAFGDGTIRWHRWSDGQELLALFVDRATKRWVAWTPTGYYMASPGGEDLIGWHVNRGWDQQADFFPASRFRDRFNRPDIVQLVLATLDEDAAIQRADSAAERREETKPINAVLPPIITIQSPGHDATFTGSKIDVAYSVRSPSGLPIEKVEVLLDGSPTGVRAPGVTAGTTTETNQSVTINLPPRDVDVGLVAKSGELVGEVTHIKLTYRGAAPEQQEVDALKPTLYALVVGVSNYQNPSLRLDYSAKDAQDIAVAFKAQSGGLYRDVKVKLLTDSEATVTGFKDGLLWLQKETTSRDLAIVFLAGHGMMDAKNQFWYLPYEADVSRLISTGVSRTDIMGVLRDLPGKKILFLDACHAGAVVAAAAHTRSAPVDVNAAVNDFATADSGLVVYGASMGREFSIESDAWHHGAFTKALLEAIGEGKADIGHKGTITTAFLDAYLATRVKELTDGAQHPVMSRPDAVPDFPLALVR